MTRLLALGAAALAGVILALLLRSRRDVPSPPRPGLAPDPFDDVQWDPWTRAMADPGTRSAVRAGLVDMATGNLATLTPSDRDWLSETRSALYPAT